MFSFVFAILFSFFGNLLPEDNYYIDGGISQLGTINVTDNSTYHLFTRGRAGELYINGEWKNAQQIVDFLSPKFNNQTSKIRYLNIYGSEFAKGDEGMQAVRTISEKLGVSVAASNNITGKDGDWVLEVGNNSTALYLPFYSSNL